METALPFGATLLLGMVVGGMVVFLLQDSIRLAITRVHADVRLLHDTVQDLRKKL